MASLCHFSSSPSCQVFTFISTFPSRPSLACILAPQGSWFTLAPQAVELEHMSRSRGFLQKPCATPGQAQEVNVLTEPLHPGLKQVKAPMPRDALRLSQAAFCAAWENKQGKKSPVHAVLLQ